MTKQLFASDKITFSFFPSRERKNLFVESDLTSRLLLFLLRDVTMLLCCLLINKSQFYLFSFGLRYQSYKTQNTAKKIFFCSKAEFLVIKIRLKCGRAGYH